MTNENTHLTQLKQTHFTYADCLTGNVPVPKAGEPGKLFFLFLMVGGMVTFMVTFNGLRHCGWNIPYFFSTNTWMYPVIMAIAMLVRSRVGDPIVGFVAPRFINPRFSGVLKTLVMTLLNVAVMCPIMCAIVTLLLAGPHDFLPQYLSALPVSYAVAVTANLLVVAPVVKLLHAQAISSTQGMRILITVQQNLRGIAAIFGC